MTRSAVIIGTRGYPSYYGGFETAVRKLAPFLADEGWNVCVYGRPGNTKADDPDRDSRIETQVTRGLESQSLSTLTYGLTASIHAARRRPNVALIMNVANGFYLPLLKLRKIPTVVNVDGIEWDRAKWGRVAKLVFRAGAWMTAKFADQLVFDSHEIARRWKVDFKRDGVYIPYGGDVPPELPVEPGLSHRNYVLLVARFVPENSILEFLHAAERIAEHVPVVIVGSSGYGGPLDEKVRQLSTSNKNIIWLGHISDDSRLLALWQHASVYFHGHSVGGTNPTLVQALATGTPIVARNTVYNREVLPEGSLFFEPNADSIVHTVLALAQNPDAQVLASRLNFERSRESFTWEQVCSAYSRELQQFARKSSD